MTDLNGSTGGDAEADGSRRRRPWIVGGLVGAVVLVGAVIAVTASSGDDEPGGVLPTGGGSAITASPTPDESATVTPEPTPSGSVTPTSDATEPAPSETWQPGAVDDAVPLDDVASPEADVTVRLARLEAVQGTAQGPGQVAGPALRVTLELTNGTSEAIPLNAALVQVYCGPDRIPGDPLSGPGVSEFSGSLAVGESATGVYVLTCPVDLRDDVQITFGYVPAGSKVAFEGAAPRG